MYVQFSLFTVSGATNSGEYAETLCRFGTWHLLECNFKYHFRSLSWPSNSRSIKSLADVLESIFLPILRFMPASYIIAAALHCAQVDRCAPFSDHHRRSKDNNNKKKNKKKKSEKLRQVREIWLFVELGIADKSKRDKLKTGKWLACTL